MRVGIVSVKIEMNPIKYNISCIDRIRELGGVYLMYTKERDLLYVGKSINVKKRLYQHLSRNSNTSDFIDYVYNIECIYTTDRCEQDVIETYLINKMKPIFNSAKTYNYRSARDTFFKKYVLFAEKVRDIIIKWRNVVCSVVSENLTNVKDTIKTNKDKRHDTLFVEKVAENKSMTIDHLIELSKELLPNGIGSNPTPGELTISTLKQYVKEKYNADLPKLRGRYTVLPTIAKIFERNDLAITGTVIRYNDISNEEYIKLALNAIAEYGAVSLKDMRVECLIRRRNPPRTLSSELIAELIKVGIYKDKRTLYLANTSEIIK